MASGRTAALVLVVVGAAILVACINGWSFGQVGLGTTTGAPAEADATDSKVPHVEVVFDPHTGAKVLHVEDVDSFDESEAAQATREAKRAQAEAERAAQIAKQAQAKALYVAEMEKAKAAALAVAAKQKALAARVAQSAKIAQARAEQAKPARWEYKILQITEEDYPAAAEARLNGLSEDGYELLTDAPPKPGTSYLLRRAK
jgi:hypothetical protein